MRLGLVARSTFTPPFGGTARPLGYKPHWPCGITPIKHINICVKIKMEMQLFEYSDVPHWMCTESSLVMSSTCALQH